MLQRLMLQRFQMRWLSAMGGLALLAMAPAALRGQGAGTNDAQIQTDVQKALDNQRFKDVHATVQSGDVTLQGSVADYADKQTADNRIHHVKRVKGVNNQIEVAGPAVGDVALRDKLARGLSYDRVGYGTTAFNAITIGVQDGVVTLGGTVYGPTDKDSALSLVANTPGVRDVVDNLEVAPLSPMDDQLRLELARAIYGAPQLQKYALDPAKPIRITVVNGNVTLSGVVDNKMDSEVANLRANSVSGVFKVVNDLQVTGSKSGK
jgi:hyperosmotically inducible periplasmic protein